LSRLIGCALQETAPLWPDIKRAFGWVHRAAHILNNTEALPAPTVARRLDGLCGALCRHRACAGDLADGVDHFLKVTRSYRPGLFHCHAVADLPGTNNGLEGLFGSYRCCQRGTTGRRSASSAVRGPARLVASVTSHLAPPVIWPRSIGPAGKRCAPTSQHAACNEPEEAASDEIRKLICASWKLNMPPPSKLCRSGKKQERQNRLSVEGVRRKSSKGGWRCPGVGVV